MKKRRSVRFQFLFKFSSIASSLVSRVRAKSLGDLLRRPIDRGRSTSEPLIETMTGGVIEPFPSCILLLFRTIILGFVPII